MSEPYELPIGDYTGYTIQVFNDVTDFPPHTFIVVTGPDDVPHGYGFAPVTADSPEGPGQIQDDTSHAYTVSSDTYTLTAAQYNNLATFIDNAIASPPYYNITNGQECTNWVYDAINSAYGQSVTDPGWSCPSGLEVAFQD